MNTVAFVDVSTVVGDDELGDGSEESPVRTSRRAQEISALVGGAPIRVNGEVSNETWRAEHPDGNRWFGVMVIGALLLSVAMLVGVGVLVAHHPLVLLWAAATVTVLALGVFLPRSTR